MKVLVTGSDGYIGSQLTHVLIEQGFEVVGLDTGYYREGWLCSYPTTRLPSCLNKDIRQITEADLEGFDAVVHLAELSNDPLGQHNPAVTYDINHLGTTALAQACIRAGVSRFVYTSSCSVYGAGDGEGLKTEESEPNPQTAYARCKVLVERDVARLASGTFSPTFLRNATAYGVSARMRFDIVLNNLAGWAWTKKEIRLTSDGSPWRPLVHIHDIAHAIVCTLRAPLAAVHNQVFNVGSTTENYRVRQIAEIVAETFPGCTLSLGKSDGDNRSYRVNFDKIHERLPGFRCAWTVRRGAQELFDVFRRIDMAAHTFEFRAYTRLKQLEYLLQTKQIDESFYWLPACEAESISAGAVQLSGL